MSVLSPSSSSSSSSVTNPRAMPTYQLTYHQRHPPTHHSLTNSSPDTRWSLDLRWQDASLPAGFWGIKDPILLRKAG